MLDKPYNDVAVATDYETPTDNGLDNVWRKFSFTFTVPRGPELLTDLTLDFASRGKDNTYIYLDLVEMLEHTVMAVVDNTSLIQTSGFINNQGIKDLIGYDSIEKKLKVCKGIFDSNSLENVFPGIQNITFI